MGGADLPPGGPGHHLGLDGGAGVHQLGRLDRERHGAGGHPHTTTHQSFYPLTCACATLVCNLTCHSYLGLSRSLEADLSGALVAGTGTRTFLLGLTLTSSSWWTSPASDRVSSASPSMVTSCVVGERSAWLLLLLLPPPVRARPQALAAVVVTVSRTLSAMIPRLTQTEVWGARPAVSRTAGSVVRGSTYRVLLTSPGTGQRV